MTNAQTIKQWRKDNKELLKYKDAIIYDYDSNKKYILTGSIYYDFTKQEKIKSKNIINYLNRLYILMEYNQEGSIFLQVNY